jgi:AcrR family transcriptional regulator
MVVANQRRRLFVGTARALAERDYTQLTVKHVVEAASVSRATFEANFDNKRDCILAAHRDVFKRLERAIRAACAAERDWAQGVRAALAAAFAFALAAPQEARLLTLDALAADLTLARAVIDSNARLAVLLREGRRRTPYGPQLPELVEEGLVAAVSAVLGRGLLDPGVEGLRALQPEVLQLVLTPYLGVQEAARVAAYDF